MQEAFKKKTEDKKKAIKKKEKLEGGYEDDSHIYIEEPSMTSDFRKLEPKPEVRLQRKF